MRRAKGQVRPNIGGRSVSTYRFVSVVANYVLKQSFLNVKKYMYNKY